ncbi:MAG: TolC family protein [Prevotella sp.]|nr:TolC family protein [Prevotella sp.]
MKKIFSYKHHTHRLTIKTISRAASCHLITLLLTLTATTASGQEILTLQNCRQLALQNNKQLVVARLGKEVANNQLLSARTKYLPRVDAIAGYELTSREVSILNKEQKDALNNLGTNAVSNASQLLTNMVQDGLISPQTAQQLAQQLGKMSPTLASLGNDLGTSIRRAFRTNNRNMMGGSVMVSQPLYMGGSINTLNQMAEINTHVADDNYDLVTQQTLFEIESTYWLVVSLKQKEQLADSYLNLVQKLNDDVHKMINQGVATKADGLNIGVRLNEVEMNKMRVEDNVVLAKMLLCQLCGLPMDKPITLADEGKDLSTTTGDPALPANVDSDRPELRLLYHSVALAEQASKLITATYYRPQVALTGGFMTTNPSIYNGFEHKFYDVWNIGILVRMPLWSWNEGRYKLNAAKAATNIAEMERKDLSEKINLQVEQNRFKVREANRRMELAQKHVASAEENLRCANLGFHKGVTSLTDLMAAQTAWESAHSQKIDAEIEVRLAQLGLRKAIGSLNQ